MHRKVLRRSSILSILSSSPTNDIEVLLAYCEMIYSFSPLGILIPWISPLVVACLIIMFSTSSIIKKR